jgi:hypothetical protein
MKNHKEYDEANSDLLEEYQKNPVFYHTLKCVVCFGFLGCSEK